jgi:GT2 family glycosyltransferase
MEKAVVVILNHNGKALLESFLSGVVKYSYPHRIVIVDNASTDDSLAFVATYFPHIECIQHDKNEGFARGYNLALRKIKAKYYILINADIEVTGNWIKPILELMEKDEYISACQPKILSYRKPEQFEYAGAAGGFIDLLGYPFCRGRLFASIEKDQGQYDDTRAIFWASGACMFLRSSVFWELGGFDEFLFAYYEEIDLCWRMQRYGYKIYYCGHSKVYHVGSATVGADNPHKTYLKFRNRALVLYKNMPRHFLGWKHGFRIVLDFLAALQALLCGRIKHSWAIVQAQFSFFKLKKNYEPALITQQDNQVYDGILPFIYFIQGKRKFSSLHPNKFINQRAET